MTRKFKKSIDQTRLALKKADPKSRDRIRHKLRVFLVADQIAAEIRAERKQARAA